MEGYWRTGVALLDGPCESSILIGRHSDFFSESFFLCSLGDDKQGVL